MKKILKIILVLSILIPILFINQSKKIKLTFISNNCDFLIVTNDGNIKDFIVQGKKSIILPVNYDTIISITATGKFSPGTRVILRNGLREAHLLNFDIYKPTFIYNCQDDTLTGVPLIKPKKNGYEKYNHKGDLRI